MKDCGCRRPDEVTSKDNAGTPTPFLGIRRRPTPWINVELVNQLSLHLSACCAESFLSVAATALELVDRVLARPVFARATVVHASSIPCCHSAWPQWSPPTLPGRERQSPIGCFVCRGPCSAPVCPFACERFGATRGSRMPSGVEARLNRACVVSGRAI